MKNTSLIKNSNHYLNLFADGRSYLQCVNSVVCAKHNTAKLNKTRSACIGISPRVLGEKKARSHSLLTGTHHHRKKHRPGLPCNSSEITTTSPQPGENFNYWTASWGHIFKITAMLSEFPNTELRWKKENMEFFLKVWQNRMLQRDTEKMATQKADSGVLSISGGFRKGSLAMFTTASSNLP